MRMTLGGSRDWKFSSSGRGDDDNPGVLSPGTKKSHLVIEFFVTLPHMGRKGGLLVVVVGRWVGNLALSRKSLVFVLPLSWNCILSPLGSTV